MKPEYPLIWNYMTHLGEPVTLVRLIYVDVMRAWAQDPPRDTEYRKDTGYQTIRDYNEMRDYIKRRFPLHRLQYEKRTHECWVWVPSPESPNYRTKLTQWKTILRRWPTFLDPEFVRKGEEDHG